VPRVENVDVEIRGSSRDDELVVVGARCGASLEEVTDVALLLAIVRRLAHVHPVRRLRFVAFADDAPRDFAPSVGSVAYASRLRNEPERVSAMIDLVALGAGAAPRLLVAGSLGSRVLAKQTARTLASAGVRVRAVARPGWLRSLRASDAAAFWRVGHRAVIVTGGAPRALDLNRAAAIVPPVAATVGALAGAANDAALQSSRQ
jgi:hypothetical protein